MLGDLAADVAAVARVAVRSRLLTPVLPRPSLLSLAARAPFRAINLAAGVELQAGLRPHAVAVVDDEGTLSWQELRERTRRLANVVVERVGAGGRTAFVLRNGRHVVECYAAAGAAGTAAVPVNTWSAPGELAAVARTQRPGLLVADRELAAVVRSAGVEPALILWVGEGDGAAGDDYEAALEAASSSPPPVRGTSRIVTHTSGTTGSPKGAERDVGPLDASVGLRFLEKVPLRRGERIAIAAPLFHAFGQGMMAIGVALGCTHLLQRRFDPAAFLAAMAEHDAGSAALVPVMLRRLLEVEDAPPTPRWRVAVLSGSPLPEALRRQAEERFGDIFYDLYGSTEAGFAAIATPDDHRRKPGTVGRPGRGMRVFAVDDGGRVLPPGQVGRIHVDAGFGLERYTGGEPVPPSIDGALDLGDLGYVDEDGYLYVTGRADDRIVSGGENVHPGEVETVLEAHPDVRECAVVGRDDEEYGQVLEAFVVPQGQAQLEADVLAAFVRQRLARYKVPKTFTVVDDLPRNAAGKVLRREL